MERFDIRGSDWGLQHRTDGLGAFCWAHEVIQYIDKAEYYQREYRIVVKGGIALGVVCVVLAWALVFHKHDPAPVQKVSEEEYRQVLQEVEQLRASKVADQRKIADLVAIRKNYEAQLRTQNANNAKLVQQLKEVRASVPPLPIIQKALYDEAKTDAGFIQAVRRNFGPIKVEVRE